MYDRIAAQPGRRKGPARSVTQRPVVAVRRVSAATRGKTQRVHRHKPRHAGAGHSRHFSWLMGPLVGIAVLLILILGGWLGWQVLSSDHFDGGPYRLLVVTEPNHTGRNAQVWLLQYIPDLHQLQVLDLPEEQTVTVAGGYGEYQLNAVQPLLALEKKTARETTAALSAGLAVAIDQVVVLPEVPGLASKADVEKLFWQGRHWQWWRTVQGLQPESITFLSTPVVEEAAARLNIFTQLQAECPVAIVNATTTSGLAGKVGHIVEQSQVAVVRVTDQAQKYDQTQVVVREDRTACKPVVRMLHKIVPVSFAVQSNNGYATQHRADVVIVLGQDMAQF